MTGAEFPGTPLGWVGLVVSGLVLLAVALVFLRWPGRVSGLALALVLWVAVAPWAFWVTAAAVVVLAVVWWVWRPNGGTGLLGHPRVAAVVVSAAVVVLARGWALAAGLVALLGSGVWWWLGRRRARGAGEISHAPAVPASPSAGESSADCRVWVVATGRCERCGGVLVATAPLAGPRVAGPWASCRGCGTRWAGVIDPACPEAGLVWLPLDLAEGAR